MISADDWYSQVKGRRSHDAVGKFRHLGSIKNAHCLHDVAIQRDLYKHRIRPIERHEHTIHSRGVDSPFLDQVDHLRKGD